MVELLTGELYVQCSRIQSLMLKRPDDERAEVR